MTGSLAYRKNEAAIMRGDVPEKYTRLIPFIPGERVVEFGSAEGVLALLLARKDVGNKRVVCAIEANAERHAAAQRLHKAWAEKFEFRRDPGPCLLNMDVRGNLDLLDNGCDTLVAVRMIYYLRDDLDRVFAEVAKHIPNVVLCGNRNRADRYRAGRPDEDGGPHNFYASAEGMRAVLERHGYEIVREHLEGDEIVVGRKDI